MKTNKVKVNETRFPKLTRAVLRRVSRESLEDVVRHGACGGFNGFIYYRDTLSFYRAHKADILALAKAEAEDLGEDMLAMIAGFTCLKGNGGQTEFQRTHNILNNLSPNEIAEALYSGRGDETQTIRNAMSWYALEGVARELNPEI